MLSPHELKNKEFSKSLRGYSTVEVDEHIEFMIAKYSELYRAYDALQKKLRLTEAQFDALKAEEESIRGALINAQKASSRIIDEANERSDVIMRSAKSSCDRLIAEMKADVKKETERLDAVKAETVAFKAALFEAYQTHIAQIQSIAPDGITAKKASDVDANKYADIVMSRIKESLIGKETVIGGSSVPYAEEKTEGDVESGKTISAEAPIPEDVTEKKPEADTSFEARDAAEFASYVSEVDDVAQESDDEISPVENEAEENDKYVAPSSEEKEEGGLVGSIKKINKRVASGEDDELLKIFESSANTRELSETEEFRIVYDGKKKL